MKYEIQFKKGLAQMHIQRDSFTFICRQKLFAIMPYIDTYGLVRVTYEYIFPSIASSINKETETGQNDAEIHRVSTRTTFFFHIYEYEISNGTSRVFQRKYVFLLPHPPMLASYAWYPPRWCVGLSTDTGHVVSYKNALNWYRFGCWCAKCRCRVPLPK